MTTFEVGDRVRFTPPGFRRSERTGEVFDVHTTDLYGTDLYIEDNEGRIIEFAHPADARPYYRHHKAKELEFSGAYDELIPEGYYASPAEAVGNLLKQKEAVHREKANAAARYLDANDPETKVVTNEYGSSEGIPQLDAELEVQHGMDGEDDE